MISLLLTRRLVNFSGASFLLVIAWKFILLVFTAQPIPANDAFGYDGAVVNYLLHGHYCNPSLLMAFPFSATQVYCIYPPLYQAVLFLWMSVFGPTVLAAMWFHFVLFVLYALTLLAIFRRLQTPAWAVNLAGLFWFGITFDDRPDSLAQLLGMLAVYAWVRSVQSPARCRWAWLAALLVVLAMGTNPEIGGLYFALVWLLTLGAVGVKQKFPVAPMGFMVVAPMALVALVKYGRPDLWAGFMEHAGQTPSFTGWRLPTPGDLIKLVRNLPAILFIALLLPQALKAWFTQPRVVGTNEPPVALLVCATVAISLGLILGGLFLFTANWFLILAHFQPLIVGAFLTLGTRPKTTFHRWLMPVLAASVLLVSIRAVGMSTWGVACARDINEAAARRIVRADLDALPSGSTVVMSSAYLYDAMNYPGLRFIHEDWTHPNRAGDANGVLSADARALLTLKPAELILTQFDYYRRYQAVLAQLSGMPQRVTFRLTNCARVRAPDSYPRLQQVVQHISWAPVRVELDWQQSNR
jgi:hypothetical protein